MSNAIPKWNEDRTNQLVEAVANEATPITRATVNQIAEDLDTTPRSVSSKLRKMGYDVEMATAAPKSFSEDQESTLAAFVEDNSGTYTYAEIAELFEDGAFNAKQVQGKILSMELTEHVRPAPKPETVKTYSDDEEATFVSMVKDGAYVEQIADRLNKSVNSVRGKALSLLRSGQIEGIPRQEHTKTSERSDPLTELGDITEMTVEQIAEAIEKTVRGVKTMLTRRGLVAANYDGASKKEKASA